MDDSYKEKLDALDQKLKAVEARRAEVASKPGTAAKIQNTSIAYRMLIDIIAGVAFGAAVGVGVDRLFDTKPWGLLVMILLGLAAGIRLMFQTVSKFEAERKKKEEK